MTSANSAASVIRSAPPATSSTSCRRRAEIAHGSSVPWCSRPRQAHTWAQRAQSTGSHAAIARPASVSGAAGGWASSASSSSGSTRTSSSAASYAAGGCGQSGCATRLQPLDRWPRTAGSSWADAGAGSGGGSDDGHPAQPRRAGAALGQVGVLVGVVRVVAGEVGEPDQVDQVAVGPEPQPVRGVHGAVELRVLGQRPVDPAQGVVEAAAVGQGAGDVGVHGQVVGVVRDGPAQRGERLGGRGRRCGRRSRARSRPAWTAGPGPRARPSRPPGRSRRPGGPARSRRRAAGGARGWAATACRATVRYGCSAVRPASGAGSPTAVQSCMTIRASRSGSIRTPSAGSLTQGTPAQSTPGVCPLAAASSGRPSSGRPAAASRWARATTVPTNACCSSGNSSSAPSARAASRLSNSCVSGRVGACAIAPAR